MRLMVSEHIVPDLGTGFEEKASQHLAAAPVMTGGRIAAVCQKRSRIKVGFGWLE